MGKIMKSGIEYSGGSSSGDSKKIKYDNTNSGLESTNVQDAIDEIIENGTGSGNILNFQSILLLGNFTNESYTSYEIDTSYSNYYIEVSIQGSVTLPFYIMNMEIGKKYRCSFTSTVYIDLEFEEDKAYISIIKGNYESLYISIYGIQGISTTGAEVVDNLESTDSEAALSANMGRELNEKITFKDFIVEAKNWTAYERNTSLDITHENTNYRPISATWLGGGMAARFILQPFNYSDADEHQYRLSIFHAHGESSTQERSVIRVYYYLIK